MRWGRRDSGEEGLAVDDAPATPAPPQTGATGTSPAGEDPAAGGGAQPAAIDDAELARREQGLQEVLDLMRPAVQMDGGDLALVDVDYVEGIVEVRLEGACGSCAISSATLQGGVERLLRERLSWVREVRGGVDDSLDPFESAALGRGAYVPRYE